MTIELNNNKSTLIAGAKWVLKVQSDPRFTIRVPGAFYSPAFQAHRWDGKIKFINDRGQFETGKINQVLEILDEYEVEIKDLRNKIEPGPIPQRLNGVKLRKYQFDAVKAIKYNTLDGKPFPRGILDMATNAGKTIISAAIYETYRQPTVFYVKSKELYKQAIKDISAFLPGKVGWISSDDGIQWGDFIVAMVPTVARKIDTLGPKLAKFKVVIVDECDESTSKTFKKVLAHTFNAYVKIGLSGSVFTDKRADKKIKYETIRGQFGDILYKIGNMELMEAGFSSKVEVHIHRGNTKHKTKTKDYQWEYGAGIIRSKERNGKIFTVCYNAWNNFNVPILIMVKNHEHIEELLRIFNFEGTGNRRLDWVHHERKDRDDVVERFRTGKIDILIGSLILKRGKNFPLMRTLINAGGGDSMENVLQILGRATRKHESKKVTYVHDFQDEGEYLKHHSKHRISTYKTEKLDIVYEEGTQGTKRNTKA